MFLAADDGDSAAFTALINAYKNVHDTATQLHLQSEAQSILSQLQFVTLQERTRHSNTTTTPTCTVRSTKHSKAAAVCDAAHSAAGSSGCWLADCGIKSALPMEGERKGTQFDG